MSGSELIPKSFSIRKLKTRLNKLGIVWVKRKGKGSHGGFSGPDYRGRIQVYGLPRHSSKKEVRKAYLKGLCRHFGFTDSQIREIFKS